MPTVQPSSSRLGRRDLLVAAGAASALVPLGAMAAPKAELWKRWQAEDGASTRRVDHAAWDALIKRHLRTGSDGVNRLAYGRVPPADKAALDAYVASLEATPVTGLARAEQRAFWINLYNALTVKTVLAAYPVASIRDIRISPGLFAAGPWGKKLAKIEGEPVSLDDIEHRILRPLWKDPRTHYAVNCASLGCPNLPRDAFTRDNMDELLDAGARAYANHPRGARVTAGRLAVSSIYVWFKDDFGGSDAGVIAHLRRYAGAELAGALAGVRAIDSDDYDWRLNDATAAG